MQIEKYVLFITISSEHLNRKPHRQNNAKNPFK